MIRLARSLRRLFVFLLVLLVVYSGFVMGMHGLLADALPESYGTLLRSLLTLFQASLGNFNFDEFNGLSAPTTTAATIALVVFQLLTSLLLLNLLIAFLTDAYSKVRHGGSSEITAPLESSPCHTSRKRLCPAGSLPAGVPI